jgi:hypothetical protein
MTPQQVDDKLEAELVRLSEKYVRYKMRGVGAQTFNEKLLCRNTLANTATQIKDVLFKMYVKDLEAKCQAILN